jgi:hypothetical protein
MNNPTVLNRRQLFVTTMFASKFGIPIEEVITFLTKIRMEDLSAILESQNITEHSPHLVDRKEATANEDQPTFEFISNLIKNGRLV